MNEQSSIKTHLDMIKHVPRYDLQGFKCMYHSEKGWYYSHWAQAHRNALCSHNRRKALQLARYLYRRPLRYVTSNYLWMLEKLERMPDQEYERIMSSNNEVNLMIARMLFTASTRIMLEEPLYRIGTSATWEKAVRIILEKIDAIEKKEHLHEQLMHMERLQRLLEIHNIIILPKRNRFGGFDLDKP